METIAKYNQFSADRRYDDWTALFTNDGELISGETVVKGAEGLAQVIPGRPQGFLKNIVGNSIIEIKGDSASAVSDWVLIRIIDEQGTMPQAPTIIGAGRYYDELRKEPTGWKFVKRRLTMANERAAGSDTYRPPS